MTYGPPSGYPRRWRRRHLGLHRRWPESVESPPPEQPEESDEELLSDIRDLLGPLNPAPEAPLSNEEMFEAGKVLARLLMAPPGPAPNGHWRPPLPWGVLAGRPGRARRATARTPQRSRRVATAAIGTCAVVAAGTFWAIVLQGGGHPAGAAPVLPRPLAFSRGSHAAAAALLQRAAALEEQAPEPPGLVAYSKVQDYALRTAVLSQRAATSVVATTVLQEWVGPHCKASAFSATQDIDPKTGIDVGPAGHPGPDKSWQDSNCGLTSKLAALKAVLVGTSPASAAQRQVALADGVLAQLSSGPARPAQVATFYRLLASLPGVFDAGTVTDNAGRRGEAVGVPSGTTNAPLPSSPFKVAVPAGCAHPVPGQGTNYFVINPTTGNLLETEQVYSVPPCALRLPNRPTIAQYQVVLRSGWVAKLGEPPQ